MKQRTFWGLIALIILLIVVGINLPIAKAQSDPEALRTEFSLRCYTAVNELTLQLHFTLMSNGVEDYEVSQVDIPTGRAALYTNIPAKITTHPGSYDLGYVQMDSADSPYTWKLHLTQVSSGIEFDLPFATWYTTDCGSPDYQEPGNPSGLVDVTPIPVSTPEPNEVYCQHVAINSGTGLPYCYEPSANGVIPIPPAPK